MVADRQAVQNLVDSAALSTVLMRQVPPKANVLTEPERQMAKAEREARKKAAAKEKTAAAAKRIEMSRKQAETRRQQQEAEQEETRRRELMEEAERKLAPVRKAMDAHGLTNAEQALLIADGVTTAKVFNGLSNEQFGPSGIDINKRREEQRLRDQAAEDERHAEALDEEQRRQWQQVQALITKELGSGAAASKLEHVASVAELRAFDLSSIQQLGLGIGTHFPSLPPQTSHLLTLCSSATHAISIRIVLTIMTVIRKLHSSLF